MLSNTDKIGIEATFDINFIMERWKSGSTLTVEDYVKSLKSKELYHVLTLVERRLKNLNEKVEEIEHMKYLLLERLES